VCACLATSPLIEGIVARLLLVQIFLQDGQGLLSLLLFALHPAIMSALRKSAHSLYGAAGGVHQRPLTRTP